MPLSLAAAPRVRSIEPASRHRQPVARAGQRRARAERDDQRRRRLRRTSPARAAIASPTGTSLQDDRRAPGSSHRRRVASGDCSDRVEARRFADRQGARADTDRNRRARLATPPSPAPAPRRRDHELNTLSRQRIDRRRRRCRAAHAHRVGAGDRHRREGHRRRRSRRDADRWPCTTRPSISRSTGTLLAAVGAAVAHAGGDGDALLVLRRHAFAAAPPASSPGSRLRAARRRPA